MELYFLHIESMEVLVVPPPIDREVGCLVERPQYTAPVISIDLSMMEFLKTNNQSLTGTVWVAEEVKEVSSVDTPMEGWEVQALL